MADLLATYDLPDARRRLLQSLPETKAALDALAALLAAQAAGQLDAAGLLRADAVAGGIRKALGHLLDTWGDRPLDQRLALLRLNRAARDADLVASWPYNRVGGGVRVVLSLEANAALARLQGWDALAAARTTDARRDPIYPGNLLADLGALASGVTLAVGGGA